jgi:putative methionine-R-sulfoxide reductase with GAF domain
MLKPESDNWLENLQAIVPCRTISVMQLDKGLRILDIVAFHGFLDAPHLSLPLGAGIAGMVAETGLTECVQDVSCDSRFLAAEMDIEALLSIPIISRDDKTLGVVNLSDPNAPEGFGSDAVAEAENYVRQNPFPFPF